MKSVFEEVITTENHTPEYTKEELDNAEVEFFTAENLILSNLESMNSARNNAEALDFITEDSTTESSTNVILSIQAISIANGVDKNAITGEVDFTTESKDEKDSITDKAKGFAKKLWAKVKVLIAKAKLFITKWISKAMILFVKDDAKRKEIADKLENIDLTKVKVPKGGVFHKMFGEKDSTSNGVVKSMLTFSSRYTVKLTDTAKLKEFTDYTFPEDGKINLISRMSKARYLVEGEDKDGNPILKVVNIKDSIIKSHAKNKSVGDFGISKIMLTTSLSLSKKDIHEEIDTVLEDVKDETEISENATPQELSRVSTNINAGVIGIRGVLGKVKDATLIGEAISAYITSVDDGDKKSK